MPRSTFGFDCRCAVRPFCRAVLCSALLLTLCGISTAVAEEQADAAADPAAKEATRLRARALRIFEQAKVHYRAGALQRTVELLRQAYKIYPEPVLQYNLARVLEGLGDLEGSRRAYETYLEAAGDVRDRPAIEARIESLERRIAQERLLKKQVELEREQAKTKSEQQPRKEQVQTQSVATVADHETPEVAEKGRKLSYWPWVVLGAGAAGLIAGGVLGGMASSRRSEADDEATQKRALELQQNAEDLAVGANIAFAVGGTLLAAGTAWAIIDYVLLRRYRAREQQQTVSQLSFRPTVGGASMILRW